MTTLCIASTNPELMFQPLEVTRQGVLTTVGILESGKSIKVPSGILFEDRDKALAYLINTFDREIDVLKKQIVRKEDTLKAIVRRKFELDLEQREVA